MLKCLIKESFPSLSKIFKSISILLNLNLKNRERERERERKKNDLKLSSLIINYKRHVDTPLRA